MTPKLLFGQVMIGGLLIASTTLSQVLKPGFDKEEYIETLKINQKTHIALNKWADNTAVPDPTQFTFVYRSPVVAFDNIWDLWIHREKRIAMIAVQGSIPTGASFLANLYAAMIPAKGELQLDKDFKFTYTLARSPNAAVHVGWFVAMAYLSKTVEHKIDSCYKAGIKDFILTGHSQGGGIVFLLNSYLENLKIDGKLARDIRFKTYCSAGPKPGNLPYAYEYETMTKGGWAYNAVNSADWVPDVPFTVQTVADFTSVNPFRGAKAIIKKQKFPKNLFLKHVYNRMSKPSEKASRNYQKFLGNMLSQAVKKNIPGFITPTYYNSSYYVRTGNTIVLYADEAYFKLYNNARITPISGSIIFPNPIYSWLKNFNLKLFSYRKVSIHNRKASLLLAFLFSLITLFLSLLLTRNNGGLLYITPVFELTNQKVAQINGRDLLAW